MNLEQLRLMAQIAEHGSLTRAAIAANSQQSVMSRQLNALETECGGRLFYRTGRGVTLTELGASVLPRIKNLLAEFDQLTEEMRRNSDQPTGEVRLGILPAFGEVLVSKLYIEAREKLPQVKLKLFEGSNGQLDEWLVSGRIDLALYYRYGEVDESIDRVLATNHACLVGAFGDPRVENDTIAFHDLENLPLILPSAPNALRTSLDQLARQQNISLKVAMEADSLPIQKYVANSGEAYAIVGGLAVAREVSENKLQASKIVDPIIKRNVILSASTHHIYTQASRALAKLLEPLAMQLLKDPFSGQ